jgi:hypothetical protein
MSEEAHAPEGFSQFLWFMRNWRTYWKALISFAVVCFVVAIVGQIGTKVVVDAIRAHFATVTLRVVHFNDATGETTLEFNNTTDAPVPISSVYITVAPTNSVPMRPLPPHLAGLVLLINRATIRVPGGAGLEFGSLSGKDATMGRPISMAVLLTHVNSPMVLPHGETVAKLVPVGTAFSEVCDLYAEGAKCQVKLHVSLIDKKGQLRRQETTLGTYVVGDNYRGLEHVPYSKELDVLRKAHIGGTTCNRKVFTCPGSTEIPPMDDKVEGALFINTGTSEILVQVGERITGLLPVVFIRKSILYGCQFSIEMAGEEKLPTDVSAWVLTHDEGKTIMNVPMAFSDNWSHVHAAPTLGKEYTIPLPSTNWCVLVGGQRWARILEGAVKYTVKEQTWLKLIPADDATQSVVFSNYNRIALQQVTDDPSWTPVTNGLVIPTNAKTYLVVRNEAAPDLSMFATLRLPDNQSNSDRRVNAALAGSYTNSANW